jgi:uncharacterized protein YdeI (YjbR/CyaY-like superfamily)
MKIGKTLYVSNRNAWRKWLSKHHKTAKEIWLVYYRKSSGKARIEYNAAVEEALCYGWIDSIEKGLNKERFAQRFSPRKVGSNLSQPNVERVRRLIANKKMTRAGLAAIAHAYDPHNDKQLKTGEPIAIPAGIKKALRANKKAWTNFQRMPAAYKRVRIAYIETRKRHGRDHYVRALRHFVKMTAQNKRIGFIRG